MEVSGHMGDDWKWIDLFPLGLDSCSILGMASHLMGKNHKIQSFSISFDGEGFDEAEIASRMAQHVGTQSNILKANSELLTQRFPDV